MAAPKLTRIHIGLGFGDEIGVQYEADDGAGGTTTQKGFLTLSPGTTAAVWAEAETGLAAHVALFPADMPIAEVATALRKKRDAEAASKLAREEEAAAKAAASEAETKRQAAAEAMTMAEEATAEAEATRTKALADVEAALARKAAIEAEIAAAIEAKTAAEEPAPAPVTK